MLAPVGTLLLLPQERAGRAGSSQRGLSQRRQHRGPYALPARIPPERGPFRGGAGNFTGIWGLDAAVRIQLALTPKSIESHILELTGYAGAALQRKGWQIVSSRAQGEASGNLSFKHAGYDAQEIAVRLRNAGVDLAVRGGNLRISPTYYNDTSEIDRLVEALPS